MDTGESLASRSAAKVASSSPLEKTLRTRSVATAKFPEYLLLKPEDSEFMI